MNSAVCIVCHAQGYTACAHRPYYEAAKDSEQPVDWAYTIERAYISGPAEHSFDEFLLKASNAHTIDIHMRGDGKEYRCQADFLKHAKKSRNFLAQPPKRESGALDAIKKYVAAHHKVSSLPEDAYLDSRKMDILVTALNEKAAAFNAMLDLINGIEGESQ